MGPLQGNLRSWFIAGGAFLKGKVVAPSSKSHTLRAILFGALASGKSFIDRPLPSPDSQAMAVAAHSIGASIDQLDEALCIEGIAGKVFEAEDVIFCANSGIVLRFFTAVAALGRRPFVLTGDRSIRTRRGMLPLLQALSQLHVSAISIRNDGYAPLIIQGPMKGGEVTINGEDSQHISALLIAAPFTEKGIVIHPFAVKEKPWIELTLGWLNRLGIRYERDGYDYFFVPGQQNCLGFNYRVPGDMSSIAFLVGAALITHSEVSIDNVDMEDEQGDKELIYLLQKMGARIEIDALHHTIKVLPSPPLSSMKIDVDGYIDAIPILAVLGCYAEGEVELVNGGHGRNKESDRLFAIREELSKMGASIEEREDGLLIHPSSLKGVTLFSHHDHRIAMALAVAALGAVGESVIMDVDWVKKSFPSFAVDLSKLGAAIDERE